MTYQADRFDLGELAKICLGEFAVGPDYVRKRGSFRSPGLDLGPMLIISSVILAHDSLPFSLGSAIESSSAG